MLFKPVSETTDGVDVTMTDAEVNAAVCEWAARQGVEQVAKLVEGGGDAAFTLFGGGKGGLLRLTRRIPPPRFVLGDAPSAPVPATGQTARTPISPKAP